MKLSLPLVPQLKCDFHYSTLIAAGAGLGAAFACGFLPWYYLILPGAILFTLNGRQLAAILTAFILCFISGSLQYGTPSPALHTSTVQGELICTDRRCTGLDIIPDVTRPTGKIRTSDGEFDVRIVNHPGKQPLSYGDKFYFQGVLAPAKPAGLICENGEITGEISPVFGNTPNLTVTTMTPAENSFSFLRPFLKIRNIFLKRLLCKIRDPEIAQMSALLFFGASQGAYSEHKQNFAASGIIHLFSVSGLHVTLVAGIILLFLRPLPFALRYRVAALFTLLYVLCSGASLPAIRAGSMIILWCIMRSSLYPSAAWNALMFTWSIFALLIPESIGTLSAQYSFGITAALLLLSERTKEYFTGLQQQVITRMPSQAEFTRSFIRKSVWMKKFLLVPIVTVVAFAAGAGISLYRQNLFTPGSIAGNLILVLITPLLFGSMIFKMSAGALFPAADHFGAYILESTFYLLSDLTAGIADLFDPVLSSQPPLWSVMLFYLLFFGALGMKSSTVRKICTLGFLTVSFCGIIFSQVPTSHVTVINNGANQPPMIIMRDNGMCSIINVPDYQSAVTAAKLLRGEGISHAQVHLSKAVRSSCAGLPALSRRMDLSVQYPQFAEKPTKAFLRNVKESNADFPDIDSTLQIYEENNQTIYCLGKWEFRSENTDDGRVVEVKTAGFNQKTLIPWCSLPAVWECEIK
ncbi:MAG: ComEC/Rec2 family competence protein [Lentisphaeria bacterium]|nr:ComEC/Rec2 family competence protein [Lentisphaeria bacterium]